METSTKKTRWHENEQLFDTAELHTSYAGGIERCPKAMIKDMCAESSDQEECRPATICGWTPKEHE